MTETKQEIKNMYQRFICEGYIEDLERLDRNDGRTVLRFYLKYINVDIQGKEYPSRYSCAIFDSFGQRRAKDLISGDFVLIEGVLRPNDKDRQGVMVKIDNIKHLDRITRPVEATNG